jgi:uncharacterized protein YbaP (TraB family)
LKLKRFLSFLLAVIACFSFCSCEPAEDPSLITPLLYEVTDGNGGTVWLFGSIHIGEENFYPLPRYVLRAFKKADVLAVEFDIVQYKNNAVAKKRALEALSYKDGSTTKKHISNSLYTEAIKILKESNLYDEDTEKYYPSAWSDFIDDALYTKLGIQEDLGIDRYFIDQAYKTKKKIAEIESLEEQYEILANFSESLQISLLASSIKAYKEADAEKPKEKMKNWALGDEAILAESYKKTVEFSSEKAEELYNEYYKAIVIDRNIKMVDYAEKALKSGEDTFICVGAAHIIGEGAMVETLRERGYTVKAIRGTPKADTSSSIPAID